MTLIELKKFINNKAIPSDFMIFITKDCPFLARQYLAAIEALAGGLTKVNSIYAPQQSSAVLLTAEEDSVSVLTVDTFNERAEDYSQFERTIVVCEQVDKSVIKNVEQYVIKFPKLAEWQILDYATNCCKHIEEADLKWLINASNKNMDYIDNELSKVSLFTGDAQKEVFAAVRLASQADLYNPDTFTIVNALIDGNMPVLFDFLRNNGHRIIEPVVLVNRTLASLKNIILISQNPSITAEDCGVSQSQFVVLRSKYRCINLEAARNKIKFLTGFDLALKTSRLDMSKRDMLSYIINNLSYKIML